MEWHALLLWTFYASWSLKDNFSLGHASALSRLIVPRSGSILEGGFQFQTITGMNCFKPSDIFHFFWRVSILFVGLVA